MPKAPIITMTKWMPPSIAVEPNVIRPWPGLRVHPDQADGDADERRDQRLQHVAFGQAADEEQAHEGEQEVVARLEDQRQLRDQRGEQREHDDAEEIADDGLGRGKAHRPPASPILASG